MTTGTEDYGLPIDYQKRDGVACITLSAGMYILLSSTDIRIASAEHARFKFALLTQGWLGNGPGASLLAKQLRYIDAMKILLTDEPFDAQEALRIGLINEVVPHAELLGAPKRSRATSARCRQSRCA